jgi:hypothetical protein
VLSISIISFEECVAGCFDSYAYVLPCEIPVIVRSVFVACESDLVDTRETPILRFREEVSALRGAIIHRAASFRVDGVAYLRWVSKKYSVGDEVLTRQCPYLGLSIRGESVDAWRIRRLQMEIGVHRNLPGFGPPEGKDLHPACLILYCLYN